MAFKIQAKELNADFIKSIRNLNSQKIAFKHSWHLKALSGKLDKALDFVQESYTNIAKEYFKTDESGNFVPRLADKDITAPDGKVMLAKGSPVPNSYTPKEEGSEKEAAKRFDELMNSYIDIDHSQLPFDALESLEISASELDILEAIIAIPQDVKDNVVPLK